MNRGIVMQMSINEAMNSWMKKPSGKVCLGWRGEKWKRNHVGIEKNMVMAIIAQPGLSLSQLMAIPNMSFAEVSI